MKKTNYGKFLFSALIIIFCFSSCLSNRSGEVLPAKDETRDSIPSIIKEKPPFVITYRRDSITDYKLFDSIYSPGEKKIIYALNRIEPVRVGAGSVLIIPDSLTTDLMFYAPFPGKLDLLDSIPKTVLISQRIQAFGLYENGKLLKWGPVSSGKQSTPTPNGLHYGNYKAQRKVSTVNSDWILPYYFNFMNFEGVGVHQYLLPGFPASHACVRLDMDDAKFIYNWADQWKLDARGREIEKNGTPFMVFGDYDFNSETLPWAALTTDPEANFLNDSEFETIENYVKSFMKDSLNFNREQEDIKDLIVGL